MGSVCNLSKTVKFDAFFAHKNGWKKVKCVEESKVRGGQLKRA